MAFNYKIRILLWLLFAVFSAFLFNKKLVPTGHISYSSNFIKSDYFISQITPEERIYKKNKNTPTEIIGDPVYFTLHAPRGFKEAKLKLDFQLDDNLQEIKAGVLKDKIIWRYELQPLYNRTIESLSEEWNTLSENGLVLLQKEKKFDNIDAFLKNLPAKKEIAVYNYNLPDDFRIIGYKPLAQKRTYPFTLRGAFEFYLYLKNEPMNLSFDFSSLNKNKDKDDVDVNIYQDNKSLRNYHLEDTNISKDNGEVRDLNCFKLDRVDLPEGIYKIEVKANNDVITKNIITSQSKLSFINKIWIFGNTNQTTLFTDSPYLSAETVNPGSLQEINFGPEKIKLKATYKLFTAAGIWGVKKITFTKNDILLAGNGVFALSNEELINPAFADVSTLTDPDKQGTKYILAKYNLVKKSGESLEAVTDIDLAHAYQENNKYSFIISTPSLNAGSGQNNSVKLVSAEIDLAGDNIWTILKRRINKIFER